MVHYLGRDWTRAELTQHVGHMRQVAGIHALEQSDGTARNGRVYQVYTGTGMTFDVLADRALDVASLRYKGHSLTWQAAAGAVHPAYYEAGGLGWLRSFPGGLFTTCGLDQFGSPAEDNGESFGIHGRISNLPAEQVAYHEGWQDDDYVLSVSGQIRQTRLFGENLLLSRCIRTALGSNTITLEDTVINDGFQAQPHMMLYHCNLGFPLLSASAQLEIKTQDTIPRDEAAAAGVAHWSTFQPPTSAYAEQVFRHVVLPDDDGLATATLRNPELGLALQIRYSQATLPHLFQWKQAGQGAYVLGIEPANSSAIEGRAAARARDDLPLLAPGEMRQYLLKFTIIE